MRTIFLTFTGLFGLLIILLISIRGAYLYIEKRCIARCYSNIQQIPSQEIGIILGTSPTLKSGRDNPYYTARIRAGAQLFHAKKVQFLLVSGDNGHHHYDEVSAMKRDLIIQGVPEERIYRDHAGFRTLDSIVRAQHIFSIKDPIIISQAFHNARALFLADQNNLGQSTAFNAVLPSQKMTFKNTVREHIARFWAFLDIYLFNTQPKFLGDPIQIGSKYPEPYP